VIFSDQSNSSGSAARLGRKHRDAAADWLTRIKAGLTAAEQVDYARWLAQDPRNLQAINEMKSTWAYLEQPRFTGQAAAIFRGMKAQEGRTATRRRLALGFAFAGAAALALLLAGPRTRQPAATAASPNSSVVTNPEHRVLSDGSIVEVNHGGEIAIDFSSTRRGVRLVAGEAHFKVAKDPQRPFVVTAGAVSVQAVGTAFAVTYAPEQVDVLVTEGRVAVTRSKLRAITAPPSSAPADAVYLDAAHRLSVSTAASEHFPPTAESVTPDQIAAALSWRKARVEFTDTPLDSALTLFNAHNQSQLTLLDPALGKIRISGIFWTDDPEGFARLLQSSASLQVLHEAGNRIVLRKP